MEFKVGDRVRIIESGFVGEIFSIENRLLTSLDGTIEGCCIDFYEVVGKNGVSFSGLQGVELELIEKAIEHKKIKTQEQIKIEDLEQRIEKLEKYASMGKYATDRKENVSNFEKTTQKSNLLSEDERVILRNLDKNWKWIARDEDNELYIFETKPCKESYFWSSEDGNWQINCYFTNLFQFIKWNDKEPYNIEELLKGESGNDD